jgi:ribosomal protein L37E
MNTKNCPKCDYPRLKRWEDLTDEQKFLAERLPGSAEFSRKERKNHLFCTRCWHEIPADENLIC